MSESQYHYDHAGVTAGPVPGAELLQHGVGRDTLVWTAGMSGWLPAGQVEALAPLFVALPPPLPSRPGPPPLPPPKAAAEAPPSAPAPIAVGRSISPFAPDGYSLPLFGKFAEDATVWAMDAGEPLGTFSNNSDLQSLHKWGFQSTKQYRFQLLNSTGQLLLTLHKPKASLFNPLNKGELHVLDSENNLLGICRCGVSFSTKRVVTVEDVQGNELMLVNHARLGSRDFVLETSTGVLGRGRRSRTAEWTQMLLEFQYDRIELIFEPNVLESRKALGIGAVVAGYLLVSQL